MNEDIMKILEDHENRIKALENKILGKDTPKLEKPISLKEFMLSKKPTSDVQKTLIIGYFLEKYEGFQCFNAQDIENGFRNCKEPVPNNINLCVIRNIEKGFMMESKEKKEETKSWILTNSGERAVENESRKEQQP